MFKSVDIQLVRRRRTDQGTEGIICVPMLHFSSFSFELPWRDNGRDVSCIPPGTYPLAWRVSRRFKTVHIQNVPDRSAILIHSGNFAGDVEMGFRSDTEGCILLGDRFGEFKGQRAVLNSRATVREFKSLLYPALTKGGAARITIIENLGGQWM